MTNIQIVDELARARVVERLLLTQTQYRCNPYINDLAQDIYIDLLNKDAGMIERLYNEGTLIFFIMRMIRNNLYSSNSPFYYDYQRFRKLSNELPENAL